MKTNLRVLFVIAFVAILVAFPFNQAHAASGSSTASMVGGTTVYLPMVNAQSNSNQVVNIFPTLNQFINSVKDNTQGTPRGVYVAGVLANAVVQQPASDANFVSGSKDVVTQFGAATQFGVTGLLAHNNLAGTNFSKLTLQQDVVIVFGDGTTQTYRITQIDSLQALEPNNPSSKFKDANGTLLSASEVFAKYYTGSDHVTFQTCIAKDNISSWGRLFVVAEIVP